MPASAQAWDESGYWAFADKVAKRLDDSWNPTLDRYRPGSTSVDTMMNANMLLLHSVAALRGHEGDVAEGRAGAQHHHAAHEHAAVGRGRPRSALPAATRTSPAGWRR